VARAEFPALFRGLVGRAWAFWKAHWQLLLLLASAGAGLLEWGLQLHFSHAAPAPQEWVALRPTVQQLVQRGTLIIVAPPWAEPNARLAFGDELMPLRHVARADDSSFEKALEISILGQHPSELLGWQLESELDTGRFLLRSWTNPRPARVLYDFMAQAEPPALSVSVERGDAREQCAFGRAKVSNGDLHGHPTFPSRRYTCSGPEWLFVGRTVIEDQNYRPRSCVWAHPPAHGELVLRFDAVPIGATIRGYAGLPYFFERDEQGSPVDLAVWVAGEAVGHYRHSDGEGWKPFEFSTARFAGQVQQVEFRVESARPWQREFCFQAEVR
jgi:hypothetical protein